MFLYVDISLCTKFSHFFKKPMNCKQIFSTQTLWPKGFFFYHNLTFFEKNGGWVCELHNGPLIVVKILSLLPIILYLLNFYNLYSNWMNYFQETNTDEYVESENYDTFCFDTILNHIDLCIAGIKRRYQVLAIMHLLPMGFLYRWSCRTIVMKHT